jgi:hypothetical protein
MARLTVGGGDVLLLLCCCFVVGFVVVWFDFCFGACVCFF